MPEFQLKTKPKQATVATKVSAPAKKKGKKWFTRLNAWLHLWPSIVSGLILVFVCLTGTIIVYCDELLDFSAGKATHVSIGKEKVTSDQILGAIHQADSNLQISEVVFFQDPSRSIRVRAFHKESEKLNFVYVNPYTAEILKIDYTGHFFYITAHLHSNMLMGKVGGWIVTIATIIFFISSVTGLILWWPKRWTKKTRQDSFTVKWKAKFKRLNYDLHNVYGFYSLLLCFVLSLTGLIIFFHPLGELIVGSFGGSAEHMEKVLPKVQEEKKSVDYAQLAYQSLEEHPDKKNAGIWVYGLKKVGAYDFRLGVSGLKSTENLKHVVYDRYTGKKIDVEQPYIIHEEVENTVWQLHMGQWWGQFGKLSTFLAGIIGTSLPITGFLIWWGRRKKKKRPVRN